MWIYSKSYRQAHPESYFFYSIYRPMKPSYVFTILTWIIFVRYAYLTWSPSLPMILKLVHISGSLIYFNFTVLALIGICTTRYDVFILKITVDLGIGFFLTGLIAAGCLFGKATYAGVLMYLIDLACFTISALVLLKCHHYYKEYLPTLPENVHCFANMPYYG